MTLEQKNGRVVMDLGPMEIWDGAELALLRDTLTRLGGDEGRNRIGIDMSSVKYVPSGFFGMLFDWCEAGVTIELHTPKPRIRKMIWFRQFFVEVEPGCFRLVSDPIGIPGQPAIPVDGWPDEEPDDDELDLVGTGTTRDSSLGG